MNSGATSVDGRLLDGASRSHRLHCRKHLWSGAVCYCLPELWFHLVSVCAMELLIISVLESCIAEINDSLCLGIVH